MDFHGPKHVVELFVKLNHYKSACSCITMHGINNNNKKMVFIPPARFASKTETITFWMLSFRMFRVWGLVMYTLYFNLMMARLVEALYYES